MKAETLEVFENVKSIFSQYLEENGHRKTPERFSILREIYMMDGHFEVETLYIKMKSNKYRVSRATLYNTIDLLLQCNLVVKHQFGRNVAMFEKSFKYRQHDHLVCSHCGKVLEFCDPRIMEIQNSLEDTLGFEVAQRALAFYGKCKECQNGKE